MPDSLSTDLRVDHLRQLKSDEDRTGIYVRAKFPNGKWGSADIYQLERESLVAWLRSRGGSNVWAENTVLILLGWSQLEPSSETPGI